MVALPNAAWAAGTAAVGREDLVDLIQESEISRYGLNNLAKDDNSIPEKWEGMGLVPLKDPENPADYLLLVGTDNDLNAPVVYHNGIPVATNAAPIDTLITAWRVTLPGVGDTAHANAQPAIAIVSPSSPTLSAPARVDLVASGYDQDGKIVKVEFFEGEVKLGEDATFPFSLRLEGVAAGTHTYRVVGRDNDGAIAEHTRSVVVTTDNLPPIASISSPAQGGYSASGAAVKIITQASDPDGYIARVEFLDGSTSLGVVSKAPFELSWASPGVGSHELSVVATDNQGATTQSTPITLHVLPGKVVSPQATVAGAAFPAWSARWWQWAISLPFNDSHPLKDEEGDEVHRGQSGPVWFLGGAVNASGVVTRKVMLPAGKYLYFPLVNAECSSVEAPPYAGGDTQVTLNACARKFQKSDLFCSVDGVAVPGLEGNRVLSPVFTFNAPQPNLLGVTGPTQGSAVDDGYYVMLEPLAPGEHTLRFGGRFGYTDTDPSLSFSFTQNITYQLTALPAGVPFITRLEQGSGGWLLTFWGEEGLSFSVESATEVAGPYSTEGAAVQGVGGLQTVSLTGDSARRFLRIRKNP